jgi:hypothetical protein
MARARIGVILSPKKQRGGQGDHDGIRKLQREQLRQRDQRQSKEPQVLTGEMRQVAQGMQAEMPGRYLAKGADKARYGEHNQ